MTDVRRLATGTVALRDDSGSDGRTIEGYAVHWADTTEGAEEYAGLTESFAPGAFADAIAARGDRPWPYLDRHTGTVVGGIRFDQDDTGLHYAGRLLDTQAARDYAATVEVNNGVSLEFVLRGAKSKRQGKNIVHTAIPRIAALAGEYVPAYQGASVALRGDNVSEEPETIEPPKAPTLTREDVTRVAEGVAIEAVRQYAERGTLTVANVDPMLAYGTIGDLVFAAAHAGREDGAALRAHAKSAIARRVLDDTVFTSGANAGLASGNLVTQELQRLVNTGRPAITAFGGPRSLGDVAGLTLNWPYFDGTLADFVAAQSAEKAAIISASVDIKLGSEPLLTYAGGTDISFQIIRRGSPSILDMYARIWLAAWSAVTDAAFVTELESGSVTVDTGAIGSLTITTATAHLITASLAVQAATGSPAQFVLASTTLFSTLANLIVPSSTAIAGPSGADIRGLGFSLGNVPIVHVPGITAGKGIVSNSSAAAWYEDGPFLATEEDVEKLGRNVAYYSMGAGARFIPAGIVEIYDVP